MHISVMITVVDTYIHSELIPSVEDGSKITPSTSMGCRCCADLPPSVDSQVYILAGCCDGDGEGRDRGAEAEEDGNAEDEDAAIGFLATLVMLRGVWMPLPPPAPPAEYIWRPREGAALVGCTNDCVGWCDRNGEGVCGGVAARDRAGVCEFVEWAEELLPIVLPYV